MRGVRSRAAALAAGLALAATAAAAAPLSELAWLAGDWRGQFHGELLEESWLPPGAGVMLGVARNSRDGKLTLFEFLMIDENGGQWLYKPRPRGRGEVDFALVEAGQGRVEFANPEHDFPQRVVYRLLDESTLEVSLSAPWAKPTPNDGFSYRLQRQP